MLDSRSVMHLIKLRHIFYDLLVAQACIQKDASYLEHVMLEHGKGHVVGELHTLGGWSWELTGLRIFVSGFRIIPRKI